MFQVEAVQLRPATSQIRCPIDIDRTMPVTCAPGPRQVWVHFESA